MIKKFEKGGPMPILNVQVSVVKTKELSEKISTMLSELTIRILNKKPDLIAIAIQYINSEDWFIAGKSLAEQGKNSFYLDIKITDETNTKNQKQQFIHETFLVFEELLNNLHEESYIHINDVRASAYGYGGLTQEYRYHHD